MARSLAFFCLAALIPAGAASAQTAVEAGLGASRAATSTAPAKGLGKAMSGLAGSLDKIMKAGKQETESSSTGAHAVPSRSAIPPPATNWEDPGGIEVGLSYADLVRRFGPGAMEITDGTGKSLTYPAKGGAFQVEVRDGKVASVAKPSV